MPVPSLLLCAHGTDDPDGQQIILDLAHAVAKRLPAVDVTCVYVDVQEPRVRNAVDDAIRTGRRVVVVPTLLTAGFHLDVDVAQAVEQHPGEAVHTGPLGPDPLLAEVLVDRLHEAGVSTGPVVLAIAGSSRPDEASIETMRALLQHRWPGPVTVGYLAAQDPSLADAVAAADHPAVAPYLVGPGFFSRRAQAAGARTTSAPLGAHPNLVDLIVRRYTAAAS